MALAARAIALIYSLECPVQAPAWAGIFRRWTRWGATIFPLTERPQNG